MGNSWSDRGDWFWQDFEFSTGERLVVGLYYRDEHENAPGFVASRMPLVWMAAKIDGRENQADVYKTLESHPPDGWQTGRRWYGERPNVWRPLAPVLTGATFDEQREAFARAVSVGRTWIATGTGADP